MSSPPRSPENAAPPVLVAGSPVLGDPAQASATHSSPPAAPTDDPAHPAVLLEAVPASQARPAAHSQPVVLNAAPTDQAKKPRRPLLSPSSNAPSLLTQALASARGILPAPGQSESPLPSQKPSRSYDTQSSHPRHGQHNASDSPAKAASDDAQDSSDGGSLTSRSSPRLAAMPSTVSTTAAASEVDRDQSPAPGGVDLGRVALARGASTESTATTTPRRKTSTESVETRAVGREPLPRSASQSSVSGNLGVPVQAPNQETGGDDQSGPSRPQARPRKMEHRLSMVPEKAWSIGTRELDTAQDGQVEKSITEVLTGAEPNRGSRKASHSLRFFKEGLPEDRLKRRDSKLSSASREILSTSSALVAEPDIVEGLNEVRALVPPRSSDEFDAPRHAKTWTVVDRTSTIPVTSPNTNDYFGDLSESSQGQLKEVADRRKLDGANPSDVGGDAATVPVSEGRRPSDDGTEVPEDGEDSGEEKISSAVFLPHQAPEVAHPTPGVIKRTPTAPRTFSRHEDFHPWLVKAGEPEADDQVCQDKEFQVQEPEPIVGEVPSSAIEDFAVEDSEVEPPAPHLSRPVSYYEDHVHEHQITPGEHFDAIELIPYKHQVGGHTTLWRFSKRAVCKQLNNRENEFYERIEKGHRDLLPFLPR
jgi:inositol-hexakisphosphate 5-kinase